jgi:hypothetical protein
MKAFKEAGMKLNAFYSFELERDKKTVTHWMFLTSWLETPEPKVLENWMFREGLNC